MRALSRLFLLGVVFTIPWENLLILPGIGTASRALGIMAASTGILAVIQQGHVRRLTRAHLFLGLFVLLAVSSLMWTSSPENTAKQVGTLSQLVVLAWLFWEMCRDTADQEAVMGAYVAGAFLAGFMTIFAYRLGQEIDGRYVFGDLDPNGLGVMVALGVPFAWYLLGHAKKVGVVWMCRLYLPLALVAVLLTGSRGGFVSLVVAFLILPLTYARGTIRSRLVLYFVGAVAIYAIISLIPDQSLARIMTTSTELTRGTLGERTVIWKVGFEHFDHPVLGVGAGAFTTITKATLGRELVAHNVFLSVLFEQGVVGLSVLVAILLLLIRYVNRSAGSSKALWYVLLMVWTAGGLTLTMEPRKVTWFLWGFLLAGVSVKQDDTGLQTISSGGISPR